MFACGETIITRARSEVERTPRQVFPCSFFADHMTELSSIEAAMRSHRSVAGCTRTCAAIEGEGRHHRIKGTAEGKLLQELHEDAPRREMR